MELKSPGLWADGPGVRRMGLSDTLRLPATRDTQLAQATSWADSYGRAATGGPPEGCRPSGGRPWGDCSRPRSACGVRRQSRAATPLWLLAAGRRGHHGLRAGESGYAARESGVAALLCHRTPCRSACATSRYLRFVCAPAQDSTRAMRGRRAIGRPAKTCTWAWRTWGARTRTRSSRPSTTCPRVASAGAALDELALPHRWPSLPRPVG